MVDATPHSINPAPSFLGAFARMPLDITRHLIGTRFWSGLSHLPEQEQAVPTDFLGINVAGSPDPEIQAFVFDRLQELGLQQVRVDAGYDAPNTYQQEFIQELINQGYRVLLRLRQPASEAADMMKNQSARTAWERHLQWAVDHFDFTKLEAVELGTTPNRKRWSGYRYREFFAAWRIACDVLADHPIRLVGPSVSDFEPLHTICMLRGLKSLNCLPQIHGVNMFSERTRIPELWDHRVAGRLLRDRLKLNLIKKFSVFDAVKNQFGMDATWCTHTCWNAERVASWTDDVESARADYMKRYLLLAAASASVQRVYWGPLIGYPDGLIYEGAKRSGPDKERVANYSLSPGSVEDMALTPSFAMLKNLQQTLAGSKMTLHINDATQTVKGMINKHGEVSVVDYSF